MPRRARPIQPPDPNLDELEKILAAADALIRRRLAAKNIRAVHLIFAASEGGAAVIRGTAERGNIGAIAKTLAVIAEQTRTRRTGESEH